MCWSDTEFRGAIASVYVPEFHRDATTGGYLRRLCCRVCIFSTDRDLVEVALKDSSVFQMTWDAEQKSGLTMPERESDPDGFP